MVILSNKFKFINFQGFQDVDRYCFLTVLHKDNCRNQRNRFTGYLQLSRIGERDDEQVRLAELSQAATR